MTDAHIYSPVATNYTRAAYWSMYTEKMPKPEPPASPPPLYDRRHRLWQRRLWLLISHKIVVIVIFLLGAVLGYGVVELNEKPLQRWSCSLIIALEVYSYGQDVDLLWSPVLTSNSLDLLMAADVTALQAYMFCTDTENVVLGVLFGLVDSCLGCTQEIYNSREKSGRVCKKSDSANIKPTGSKLLPGPIRQARAGTASRHSVPGNTNSDTWVGSFVDHFCVFHWISLTNTYNPIKAFVRL